MLSWGAPVSSGRCPKRGLSSESESRVWSRSWLCSKREAATRALGTFWDSLLSRWMARWQELMQWCVFSVQEERRRDPAGGGLRGRAHGQPPVFASGSEAGGEVASDGCSWTRGSVLSCSVGDCNVVGGGAVRQAARSGENAFQKMGNERPRLCVSCGGWQWLWFWVGSCGGRTQSARAEFEQRQGQESVPSVQSELGSRSFCFRCSRTLGPLSLPKHVLATGSGADSKRFRHTSVGSFSDLAADWPRKYVLSGPEAYNRSVLLHARAPVAGRGTLYLHGCTDCRARSGGWYLGELTYSTWVQLPGSGKVPAGTERAGAIRNLPRSRKSAEKERRKLQSDETQWK